MGVVNKQQHHDVTLSCATQSDYGDRTLRARVTLKSAKTDLKHIIFTSTGSQTPISIPLAS